MKQVSRSDEMIADYSVYYKFPGWRDQGVVILVIDNLPWHVNDV